MPYVVDEKKVRNHPHKDNVFMYYRAKQIIIDDECKKLQAIICSEQSLKDLISYFRLCHDDKLFSKSNGSLCFWYQVKQEKEIYCIEFAGELNEAITFLRRYKAISRPTEELLLNHLNSHKNIPSATLSNTPTI